MAVFGPWTIVPQPTILSPIGNPIAPRDIEWEMDDVVAANTNPFSLAKQFYAWNQAIIRASVSYSFLTNPQHFAMFAWLMQVQGTSGVFSFSDPFNVGPQHSAATAPTVNGSNQTGYSLNIAGGSNQTVGDWFSIVGNGAYSTGSRLYMITSIGSGVLGIWPPIRESPTSGESLTIVNPSGMFRMISNRRTIRQNLDKTWGSLTFEIEEALG